MSRGRSMNDGSGWSKLENDLHWTILIVPKSVGGHTALNCKYGFTTEHPRVIYCRYYKLKIRDNTAQWSQQYMCQACMVNHIIIPNIAMQTYFKIIYYTIYIYNRHASRPGRTEKKHHLLKFVCLHHISSFDVIKAMSEDAAAWTWTRSVFFWILMHYSFAIALKVCHDGYIISLFVYCCTIVSSELPALFYSHNTNYIVLLQLVST